MSSTYASEQIPEFLDAVKQVKQPNYTRDDIEDALFTFGMDVANTKRYLVALYTFKEMGFSQPNIKAALVSSNLNTDAALEKLVG